MKHHLNLSQATEEDIEISTNLILFKLLQQVGGTVKGTLTDAHTIADTLVGQMIRFSYDADSVVAEIITRPTELRYTEHEGHA